MISKTFPLQSFLIQAPFPIQNKVKNVATWLPVPTFWKSHGHFIMVSFSIKPGDQTDETESPNLNLVNKTELKVEYQGFSFSFYKVPLVMPKLKLYQNYLIVASFESP